MSEWVPCSERMPPEDERVLFVALSQICAGSYRTEYSRDYPWHDMLSVDMCGDCDLYSADQVTHWMPLPEPPR